MLVESTSTENLEVLEGIHNIASDGHDARPTQKDM
jgi:hypothetical protein